MSADDLTELLDENPRIGELSTSGAGGSNAPKGREVTGDEPDLSGGESNPRPEEFVQFDRLLRENAPDGYTPWYFRLEAGGKNPETRFGSWKDEQARLSPAEAARWMEGGGNVGIAGTSDDALVNVDIDDTDTTDPSDLKPTLMARSRSRVGVHGWYFAADDESIPNIPTGDSGEVRTDWQYVVAPGSYVETDPDDVPEAERADAGYYTLEAERPAATITYAELPAVFRDQRADTLHERALTERRRSERPDYAPPRESSGGERSALFDIEARDVVEREGGTTEPGARWEAIFHGSDTGANMGFSDRGLLHCFRHGVSHGGLQALTVLSGYAGGGDMACQSVGVGHESSGAGPSSTEGDGGAVWAAWKYAKKNGYIPDDDPVPYRALVWYVSEMGIVPPEDLPNPDRYDPESGERLPAHAYNAALSAIENKEGLTPGREKVDGNHRRSLSSGVNTAEGDADTTTTLNPEAVALRAGLNVEDGETPAKLADREKAYYVYQLIDEHPEESLLAAQPDGELYRYRSESGIWTDDGEQHLRELGHRALGPAYSAGVHRELKEQVRAANPVHREELGVAEGRIATDSGLFNLETGEVRDIRPDDHALFRVRTGDLSASGGGTFDADECPRWIEFLENSVRADDLDALQEYAGYTLAHWGQPHKRAMLLLGPQDSGKSTFLNVIRDILGGRAHVSSENLNSLVNSRWGRAELFGKVANISNELETKRLDNVALFKTITGGGDSISAEKKGTDKFVFTPTAKHLYAANEVPPAPSADDTFFSRWLFTTFPESVPLSKQVEDLDRKLLESERAGIFRWMVEGYRRLREQGRFTGDDHPARKRERWDAYGDTISRFRVNCLQVTGDPTDGVSKTVAHALYSRYARKSLGATPKSQKMLTEELKDDKIGESKRKLHPDDKRREVYTGVRWHPDALEALDFDPGAKLEKLRTAGSSTSGGGEEESEGHETASLGVFGNE